MKTTKLPMVWIQILAMVPAVWRRVNYLTLLSLIFLNYKTETVISIHISQSYDENQMIKVCKIPNQHIRLVTTNIG